MTVRRRDEEAVVGAELPQQCRRARDERKAKQGVDEETNARAPATWLNQP